MDPLGHGKKLLGMLGGILLAMPGAGAAGHTLAVRIMAQETAGPKWITSAGHAEGICPDLLSAIERAEPRLRFYGYGQGHPLPAIESGLAAGRVQAACALAASARRHAVALAVGPPLYAMRQRLAGRAGDPAVVGSIADLVRLKALVDMAPGAAFARRLETAGVAVDESTGDNYVNLRKILAGHGRFTCMNELTLRRYIRDKGLEDKIRVQPLLEQEPAWFWVSRRATPEVAELIGKALARLKASGELARIHARWTRMP